MIYDPLVEENIFRDTLMQDLNASIEKRVEKNLGHWVNGWLNWRVRVEIRLVTSPLREALGINYRIERRDPQVLRIPRK